MIIYLVQASPLLSSCLAIPETHLSNLTRYFFDAAIFVNAVFIAFDLDGGEAFFLTIFFIEIVAKLYAFGLPEFFQKLWNVFDVVVVGSAIIVSIVGLFIR